MSHHDETPTADRFDQMEQLINKRFDAIEKSNANINAQLSNRKTVIEEITNENRQLHKRVKTLEERLVKLEKQFNNTDQNHRKNNVEIEGIPSYVEDKELRAVVATLFNHIADSDIDIDDIEVAHRLYSSSTPKPTIVRLRRNHIDEIRTKEAKTKLKGIAERMGFPKGTRLYINDNQSPNMRSLAFNARLLKNHNVISETWFSNAAVRIKRTPTSKPIKITHEKDLVEQFPDFDHFTFNMELYRQLEENEDVERYDTLHGYDRESDDDLFDFINRGNRGVPSVDAALHSFRTAVSPSSAARIDEIMDKIKTMTSSHNPTQRSDETGRSQATSDDGNNAAPPLVTATVTTVVNRAESPAVYSTPSPQSISSVGFTTDPVTPSIVTMTGVSGSSTADPVIGDKNLISPLVVKPKNPHVTHSLTKALSLTLFAEKT